MPPNHRVARDHTGADDIADDIATVVFNRAALDDALHRPPPRLRPARAAGHHRRNRPRDAHTAATQTGPTPTPPPHAGVWLALVIAGCGIVIVMLALTVFWT